MAVTEDDRIQSTPRASKDPRSYEYARQMVYVLKTMWQRVTFDLKDWEKELAEARKNAIWERLGYSSLDEVLEKEVGYSGKDESRKIAAASQRTAEAAKATNGEVLPPHRPDAEVAKLATSSQSARADGTGISVAQQKKLDKLAREAPTLLKQVQDGTLSCHKACIEAGIVKVPTPDEKAVAAFRKSANQVELLLAIVGELDGDDFALFVAGVAAMRENR